MVISDINNITPFPDIDIDIDFLPICKKIAIFVSETHPVVLFIEKIFFNPKILCYHNIGYIDINSDYGIIYDGKNWIPMKINLIITKLIKLAEINLNSIYMDIKNYLDFEPYRSGLISELNEIKKIVCRYDEKHINLRDQLEKQIKYLLYDYRHLTIRSRLQTYFNTQNDMAYSFLNKLLPDKIYKSDWVIITEIINNNKDLETIKLINKILILTYCSGNPITHDIITNSILQEKEIQKFIKTL